MNDESLYQEFCYFIFLSNLLGSCEEVFTKTNSWEGNVQGTLRFTVPSDISSYTIQLDTNKRLTDIRVK